MRTRYTFQIFKTVEFIFEKDKVLNQKGKKTPVKTNKCNKSPKF